MKKWLEELNLKLKNMTGDETVRIEEKQLLLGYMFEINKDMLPRLYIETYDFAMDIIFACAYIADAGYIKSFEMEYCEDKFLFTINKGE